MSKGEFDVIVLGAGPAGAMATWHLAGSLRVLLIERERLPREKLCSGVLTPKAALGLERVIDLESVSLGTSSETWIGARGRGVLVRHDPPLRFVSRPAMDHALVKAAVGRGGVEVLEATRAKGVDPLTGRVTTADGRIFEAPVVIGADGANGVTRRVGRAYGPEGFGIEVRLVDPRPAGGRPSIVDFGLPLGYFWAFPKADGTVAVGGATALKRLPDLREHVAAFAKARLELDLPARIPGHRLPFGASRGVRGRLILAGDAAGLMDPAIAEGIPYALWSGEMAARAAFSHLTTGVPLEAYEGWVRGEWARFLGLQRGLSRIGAPAQTIFSRALIIPPVRRAIWHHFIERVPPGMIRGGRPLRETAGR